MQIREHLGYHLNRGPLRNAYSYLRNNSQKNVVKAKNSPNFISREISVEFRTLSDDKHFQE